MTKPTGRPRGRPKDSGDFRPVILRFMRRIKVFDLLWAELEKYGNTLSPKERIYFYRDMAKLALDASPRTIESDGNGLTINVLLSGVEPKVVRGGAVVHDVTPLSEPPSSPSLPDREALALREKCYPTPGRPERVGIPEPRPVDEEEERRERARQDDIASGRCLPRAPGPWDVPAGPKLYIP